jgi:hypothetical protein
MKPGDSQAKSPQENLFQSRLDQQLNPNHLLFRLARQIDWGYFEREFGAFYSEEIGRPGDPPRLPVRLRYRRNAIEPVIGHEKQDRRLVRNYLSGKEGDSINALLSGRRFNLRKLMRAFSCALRNWLSGLVFKPLTGLQPFSGCFGAV